MRRGFAPIIVIAIITVLLIGIGATVAYFQLNEKPSIQNHIDQETPTITSPTPSTTPSATIDETIAGNSGIVVKIYCLEKIYKTPCKGGVIVRDNEGKEVLRAESDSNGNLTRILEPGDYTVEALTSPANGSCAGFAQPPGSPPNPLCTNSYPVKIVQPNKITVEATNYIQVTVSYGDGRR